MSQTSRRGPSRKPARQPPSPWRNKDSRTHSRGSAYLRLRPRSPAGARGCSPRGGLRPRDRQGAAGGRIPRPPAPSLPYGHRQGGKAGACGRRRRAPPTWSSGWRSRPRHTTGSRPSTICGEEASLTAKSAPHTGKSGCTRTRSPTRSRVLDPRPRHEPSMRRVQAARYRRTRFRWPTYPSTRSQRAPSASWCRSLPQGGPPNQADCPLCADNPRQGPRWWHTPPQTPAGGGTGATGGWLPGHPARPSWRLPVAHTSWGPFDRLAPHRQARGLAAPCQLAAGAHPGLLCDGDPWPLAVLLHTIGAPNKGQEPG